MATFYVRPKREEGYGTGDGRSYANAWNGIESMEWNVIAASNPATLWVCGAQVRPTTGVLSVFVECEYSARGPEDQFTRAIAKIAGFGISPRATAPLSESQGAL
jgi:hypothetical protein